MKRELASDMFDDYISVKRKLFDRYGLRVRPEKEIPNELAWISQAFIIFMTTLVELRKLSKEFYKAYPHKDYPEMEAIINVIALRHNRIYH